MKEKKQKWFKVIHIFLKIILMGIKVNGRKGSSLCKYVYVCMRASMRVFISKSLCSF